MENIDENESEENQRMAFDTVVTGRNCVVTSDCHIYIWLFKLCRRQPFQQNSLDKAPHSTVPHFDVYQNCRTIPLQVFMNYS